jgi:hypothetical protein
VSSIAVWIYRPALRDPVGIHVPLASAEFGMAKADASIDTNTSTIIPADAPRESNFFDIMIFSFYAPSEDDL